MLSVAALNYCDCTRLSASWCVCEAVQAFTAYDVNKMLQLHLLQLMHAKRYCKKDLPQPATCHASTTLQHMHVHTAGQAVTAFGLLPRQFVYHQEPLLAWHVQMAAVQYCTTALHCTAVLQCAMHANILEQCSLLFPPRWGAGLMALMLWLEWVI
ncbi:hypothetical protein COO60DRAFT_1472977 [Scenedesmus sp. NREL 46B-D3]|nr:hypothetical protein COO60DRAFT_1472977 [Scenedesmus sp. NREL 46B-D3]